MQLQENIPLRDMTTFKIGGPARYFVVAHSISEIQQALEIAQEKSIPFFILGGGSNIVMSDDGFPGLVIKMEINGIEYRDIDDMTVEVIAGAGENWDYLVKETVKRGLYGLENLSLIPGTVGAAPVQNIGAYGAEIKNILTELDVYNAETQVVETFTNEQCEFSYRDSIFKRSYAQKYIITHVRLRLSKNGVLNTGYKDIAEYIKNNAIAESDITLKKIRDIVIDIRTNKLPNLKEYGTAGSFFKNPIVTQAIYEELKSKFPDLPGFKIDQHIKIPAAWLLDKVCSFKGYRDGDVGVYKNQALVLVNFGKATAQEISSLSEKMISCVKEKTKIILEREVKIIF
jgi:UDP-N-acetylmuramate dehydrogenase